MKAKSECKMDEILREKPRQCLDISNDRIKSTSDKSSSLFKHLAFNNFLELANEILFFKERPIGFFGWFCFHGGVCIHRYKIRMYFHL